MAPHDTSDTMSRKEHWNTMYSDRGADGVSWYQPVAEMSLSLFESLEVQRDAAIIDIGGGASSLVSALVSRGYRDLSVLDISLAALELSKTRLGGDAEQIKWLNEDLINWSPPRIYNVWHDRAVFHFLIDQEGREKYLELLAAGVVTGGLVLLATFAPDGPLQCSGLPVARYDAPGLESVLGKEFVLVDERREEHHTPAGVMQPFTWAAFKKQPT